MSVAVAFLYYHDSNDVIMFVCVMDPGGIGTVEYHYMIHFTWHMKYKVQRAARLARCSE